MMTTEWLPLMEYSMKTGVSLSTLRRHIKAKKIRYRIENGKYLVFTGPMDMEARPGVASTDLTRELQCAREEIAELKTLIAFYEESLGLGHANSDINV